MLVCTFPIVLSYYRVFRSCALTYINQSCESDVLQIKCICGSLNVTGSRSGQVVNIFFPLELITVHDRPPVDTKLTISWRWDLTDDIFPLRGAWTRRWPDPSRESSSSSWCGFSSIAWRCGSCWTKGQCIDTHHCGQIKSLCVQEISRPSPSRARFPLVIGSMTTTPTNSFVTSRPWFSMRRPLLNTWRRKKERKK